MGGGLNQNHFIYCIISIFTWLCVIIVIVMKNIRITIIVKLAPVLERIPLLYCYHMSWMLIPSFLFGKPVIKTLYLCWLINCSFRFDMVLFSWLKHRFFAVTGIFLVVKHYFIFYICYVYKARDNISKFYTHTNGVNDVSVTDNTL